MGVDCQNYRSFVVQPTPQRLQDNTQNPHSSKDYRTTMQSSTQSTLSNLVEEHITSLIRESAVVNRHSKRGGVISAAATSAAEDEEVEDIRSRPKQRRRLIHHDDVNMALLWRGSEKLYVSGVPVTCVTPPAMDDAKSVGNNNTDNGAGNNSKVSEASHITNTITSTGRANNTLDRLLATTDSNGRTVDVPSLIQSSTVPRIDLNAYLLSENAIRPPCELGMTLHWLAVEGVSPLIPANDVWNRRKVHMIENDGENNKTLQIQSLGGSKDITPLLDAMYNCDYLENDEDDDTTTVATNNSSSIRIRELQQRLLSEELQLYYARVTSTIESSSNFTELHVALQGIRSDSGIQELVPFLSRFVGLGLSSKKNLTNTDYCRRLVKVFDAMLDNTNLHLDLHVSFVI